MSYEELLAFLAERGWVLECFLPLEISLEEDPGSRATGYAAELVIESLKEEQDGE